VVELLRQLAKCQSIDHGWGPLPGVVRTRPP
jgi:hypothetical protein